MTKTEQLDQLFEEWLNDMPDYQGFKKDGINNETLFEKAKRRILFITKEPNDPKQKEGDYRNWWKKGLKYTFSHRIAEWSYGILNDFPPIEQIQKDKEGYKNVIFQIAFMNVKKSGGGGNSKYEIIEEHLIKNKQNLIKQIEIINPEIIILGLTWKRIRNMLFDTVQWKSSGYHIPIGKFNNAKVIDFYHPSARNAAAASYSLLENVVTSKSFQEL